MSRSKISPVIVATFVALGATISVPAVAEEHEHKQEIAAVLAAKTSPAQAIATAGQVSGGRATKIELEKEKSGYLYEVETVSKDRIQKVMVDPASGKVVKTDNEGLIGRIFDRDERDDFAKLTSSPTTLATAMIAAEQKTGGKAMEARFDNEDSLAVFKVKTVKDNATQRVVVNATTGKVIKVTARGEKDHDED